MVQTNRGRKQAKFYLSPEAKSLLERAAARERYDMSTMLDMLIKRTFGEATTLDETPPSPTPQMMRHAESRKQETEDHGEDEREDFRPDL